MSEQQTQPTEGRFRLRVLYWTIRLLADGPLVWMFYFLHFSESGSGGFAAAAGNAVLFLGFAVLHSVLARDRVKKRISQVVSDSWVRPLYVIFSGLTLGLVLYLWRPLDGTLWSAEGGAPYWLLTTLFALALLALIYSASQIDYPEFLGIRGLYREAKGAPPRSPRFVVKGPYAYCRHPMYLALLAALWIGPVMTLGRLEFAALATLYVLTATSLEERNLRSELGEAYDFYRANVPMWIPRWTPWRPE